MLLSISMYTYVYVGVSTRLYKYEIQIETFICLWVMMSHNPDWDCSPVHHANPVHGMVSPQGECSQKSREARKDRAMFALLERQASYQSISKQTLRWPLHLPIYSCSIATGRRLRRPSWFYAVPQWWSDHQLMVVNSVLKNRFNADAIHKRFNWSSIELCTSVRFDSFAG